MIRKVCMLGTMIFAGATAAVTSVMADDPPPVDVKLVEALAEQVKALYDYADNEFIQDEKTAELNASLQRFAGAHVAWDLKVKRVRRAAVYTELLVKAPTLIYFTKELPADTRDVPLAKLIALIRKQQGDGQLFQSSVYLKIGSTIDEPLARKLRKDDTLRVTGEIVKIGIDSNRLRIVVSQAQVGEIAVPR